MTRYTKVRGKTECSYLYNITKTERYTNRWISDSKYFGEGITFVNDKLYQLTWQEKQVLSTMQKRLKEIL
jgi:glutamine cyclotransferase